MLGNWFPTLPDEWEACARSGKLPLASPRWPRYSEVFYETVGKVETIGSYEANIYAADDDDNYPVIHLRIVAWGDFNSDGVEDVLLTLANTGEGGVVLSGRLLILTRFRTEGPLLELPLPALWPG